MLSLKYLQSKIKKEANKYFETLECTFELVEKK